MRCKYSVLQALLVAFALCVLLPGVAFAHTATESQSLAHQDSRSAAHTQHMHSAPVYIWATNVFVRSCPSQNCGAVDEISRNSVTDFCQLQSDVVNAEGYTNNWWSYILTPGGAYGWISNIYIRGNAIIAGVPFC